MKVPCDPTVTPLPATAEIPALPLVSKLIQFVVDFFQRHCDPPSSLPLRNDTKEKRNQCSKQNHDRDEDTNSRWRLELPAKPQVHLAKTVFVIRAAARKKADHGGQLPGPAPQWSTQAGDGG